MPPKPKPISVPTQGLNIRALALGDAAGILSRAGAKLVTEAMLREDVKAGAPLNLDGTLDIVIYTAWLVRETARGR